MTSQFCWNGMIVSKEHLARTMKQAYGRVSFLPVTYDLSYVQQLKDFIADFNHRALIIKLNQKKKTRSSKINEYDDGNNMKTENDDKLEVLNGDKIEENIDDNIWIMKRYRGRQSMDYPITDSLPCALRHLESSPRLACKYVTHPSLFKGRKYDLRFYVIVISLDPFVAYRHVMFVIRAANVQYSSNDLEQYQKHFTVMNFIDNNSNSEDDSVRLIRGSGERENPTSIQFIKNFNSEHAHQKEKKKNEYVEEKDKEKEGTTLKCTGVDENAQQDARNGVEVEVNIGKEKEIDLNTVINVKNSPIREEVEEEEVEVEDVWGTTVQPGIDAMLRQIFEGVALALPHEPPHPTGCQLHPNSGG